MAKNTPDRLRQLAKWADTLSEEFGGSWELENDDLVCHNHADEQRYRYKYIVTPPDAEYTVWTYSVSFNYVIATPSDDEPDPESIEEVIEGLKKSQKILKGIYEEGLDDFMRLGEKGG